MLWPVARVMVRGRWSMPMFWRICTLKRFTLKSMQSFGPLQGNKSTFDGRQQRQNKHACHTAHDRRHHSGSAAKQFEHNRKRKPDKVPNEDNDDKRGTVICALFAIIQTTLRTMIGHFEVAAKQPSLATARATQSRPFQHRSFDVAILNFNICTRHVRSPNSCVKAFCVRLATGFDAKRGILSLFQRRPIDFNTPATTPPPRRGHAKSSSRKSPRKTSRKVLDSPRRSGSPQSPHRARSDISKQTSNIESVH